MLLRVIKENLRLKVEVAFLLLKPKLYFDNKVIALYQFSSNGNRLTLGAFLIQKAFCSFPAFPGFHLFVCTYLKRRNLQKMLFLLIFEMRFSPIIIFNVSLNLAKYLVTVVKFSVISVISGVCSNSGESTRPYIYLFIRLLSAFFPFYVKMQTKQDKLCYNRLQFDKETQTNTV